MLFSPRANERHQETPISQKTGRTPGKSNALRQGKGAGGGGRGQKQLKSRDPPFTITYPISKIGVQGEPISGQGDDRGHKVSPRQGAMALVCHPQALQLQRDCNGQPPIDCCLRPACTPHHPTRPSALLVFLYSVLKNYRESLGTPSHSPLRFLFSEKFMEALAKLEIPFIRCLHGVVIFCSFLFPFGIQR